jgi:hypothetical protein
VNRRNRGPQDARLGIDLTSLISLTQHRYASVRHIPLRIQCERDAMTSAPHDSQRMPWSSRPLSPTGSSYLASPSDASQTQHASIWHMARHHPAIIISSIRDDDETSGRKWGRSGRLERLLALRGLACMRCPRSDEPASLAGSSFLLLTSAYC